MSAEVSAFELLHPRVQEQLYRMRWTALRDIQAGAIRALLQGDRHLLISAQTAGGKTEAAFLPILSQIVETPEGSVRALCISPLKALINDQFRRLEELCERAEIPVHRWHGDVGQAARRVFLERPSGVLLITPESVEALFMNRPHDLDRLFSGLQYVVIDELHSFIGTERGAHLKSLLARVITRSQNRVRLVGLSATLGDLDAACRWLAPHEPAAFAQIEGGREKTIHYQLRGYLRSASELTATAAAAQDEEALAEPPLTAEDDRLTDDLFRAFYGKTALIFANSRSKLEFYADLVRRKSEIQGLPNRFRVHHGSLSKGEREDTEAALRSDSPTATFCSSTLELGLDVGNVKEVGQIGAPWSVSSLTQRLGRSGRRAGEASVLRLYVEENEASSKSALLDRLYFQLLQAIAMTELMLEKWCEPPDAERLHLSTLVQQVMSVIGERGGARADRLQDTLITRGAFTNVTPGMFVQLLRSMGAADLIEQTPEGDLILGLRGERIVRKFDFYSAFQTEQELRVVCQGRTIGTITALPGLGADGFIILAGRRWKVVSVDAERGEIVVEPSRGGRVPYFAGAGGADLHPRVRQKMREVLLGEAVPAYLDATAKQMLAHARATAREAKLDTNSFLTDGATTYWFTWTGSRIQRTLLGLGTFYAGLKVRDEDVALAFGDAGEPQIREAFMALATALPAPEELALRFPTKGQEKYDGFLSEALQAQAFARNCLDLKGAAEAISRLI
jgi:ATP-dependent Lhr-like helicase